MAKINDSSDVAVLFVLVGWAIRYDGTEPIIGGNSYLQYNAENNTEMDAFVRDNKGYYLCGIDRGKVTEPSLDVVFVARNIQNNRYQVVGLYSKVEVIEDGNWSRVRTKKALLIPPDKRPIVPNYPAGRGMRRWARRISSHGRVHKSLLSVYKKLAGLQNWEATTLSPEQLEISAFEGKSLKQCGVKVAYALT